MPQNQLGMRTDILDNCPKAEGMMMLVRSMAPEVIAADEIGTAKDVEAIEYAMHCGGNHADDGCMVPVWMRSVKSHWSAIW